ncbi:response regulator [Sphingorhabdus contaminans]|uniref:response regulator n=1 Tax=Sphingorhabdus contaminans TaxID=1343899 RepID=UPI003D2B7371
MQQLSVVVVEDEYLISLLLNDMLNDLGHTIAGTGKTVAEGLACLTSQARPDLAILDINLNGEYSYPIAQRCVEMELPFFFVTGFAHDGIPRELGDVIVVDKPYTQHDIAAAIDQTLATFRGTVRAAQHRLAR